MLANSLTPAKPASIFDLASTPQAGGEVAPTIDFSTLLPSFDQPALSAETPVASVPAGARAVAEQPRATLLVELDLQGMPAAPARSAELPGAHATLPVLADSGKILPVLAVGLPPVAGGPISETFAETTAEPGEGRHPADAAAAQTAVLAPMAEAVPFAPGQSPAATAQTVSGGEAPVVPTARRRQAAGTEGRAPAPEQAATTAPAKAAKGAAPLAVAVHVAAAPERASPTEAVPAAKVGEIAARGHSPHAATDRGGERGAPGDERPAAARTPIKAAADLPRFHAAIDAMPTPGLAMIAEPALEGVQQFAAARAPLEAPALRELTRIVETLASAREALGTGTATLALDHAEFGALSLRFDQRGDGLLSVQLSAADADAQQAVANAVAERPIAAPGEAGASSMNSQAQSQAQGQAQGHAAASRGTLGDRDGHSPDAETQRDQRPDRQRHDTRGEQPGQRGERRSGIYA